MHQFRTKEDFLIRDLPMTRSWDLLRDQQRESIVNEDRVNLRARDGLLMQVVVLLDQAHDGIVSEDDYAGRVVQFVEDIDAGEEFRGFYINERVSFSRDNVWHVEQKIPNPAV